MIVMRISTSEALSNKQVVVTALITISYYFIKYVTMVMVAVFVLARNIFNI